MVSWAAFGCSWEPLPGVLGYPWEESGDRLGNNVAYVIIIFGGGFGELWGWIFIDFDGLNQIILEIYDVIPVTYNH